MSDFYLKRVDSAWNGGMPRPVSGRGILSGLLIFFEKNMMNSFVNHFITVILK